MARQVSCTVDNVDITIVEDGGVLTISYDIADGFEGDFRGFFFAPTVDVTSLTAAGVGVTEFLGDAEGVRNLGQGANIRGAVGKELNPTFGVEIGTPGIGKDDFQDGSFVISSSD